MKNRGFTLIELLVVISIVGLISSVALANLNSARKNAEVAAGQQFHASIFSSLADDLLGQWEFDEGSGDTAVDSSGNNRHGIIEGATYVENGVSGTALLFDGNDFITGEEFPNPGENSKMTIVAWLRPTDIATENTIFEVGDGSCTSLKIGLEGGKVAYENSEPGEEKKVTDERIVINNAWQNMAFVYNDDNTVDTYLNGAKESTVFSKTSSCTSSGWSIGSDASAFGAGYSGIIDSVRAYGVSLTASEIYRLYAEDPRSRENSVLVNR